ncbi:MAG: transcription elongation factor GreA [Bacteroidales bacterium]|nr:transcription elongation factor GreA [Bacteroidales bacterium]
MGNKSYLTQEGYNKLQKELNQMISVDRPAISQQIADARDKGDLSENAEYDAAKEAQGLLEMRISMLKETLSNSRIIDESQLDTSKVQLLNTVHLKNLKTGQKQKFTIVSESEADLKKGKISIKTPIAKGLLGKKVGDKASITIASGEIAFEIIEITL